MPRKQQPEEEIEKPKRKRRKKAEPEPIEEEATTGEGVQRGLLVIFLFACSAISLLSFIGAAGEFGLWVDKILGWMFGWGRYASPAVFGVLGYVFLHPEKYEIRIANYIGLVLFVLSGLALLHLFVNSGEFVEASQLGKGGGYFGILFAYPLLQFTGVWVTLVVLLCIFIASWIVMFNTSLKQMLEQFAGLSFLGRFGPWLRSRLHAKMNGYAIEQEDQTEEGDDDSHDETLEDEEPVEATDPAFASREIPPPQPADIVNADSEQLVLMETPKPKRRHRKIDMPPSLLTDRNEKPTSGDIEANKQKIQDTLHSFGIDVEMGEVNVGPMVTQFTLKPSQGVKLTQITTLHNDIALALAAHPIRIEAPIPGKPLVGIEVPNKATATVTLKELVVSKLFKKRKDNLTLALGKDVSGKPFMTSITNMPHLLIAGATGSGKSVCINTLIISLLYQNSPDDLKFIFVDPKRVELSVYNGIPHLLTPVITDVEKTINALKWTVSEMDRRYELLSNYGKRNIQSFNEEVPEEDRLPYIVVIIDELADLMSVAAHSVEAAIVRLAQMSRAVGIHLVLATQRPSVNVITGLIKANMPARIAFSVTSQIDSRTILDFSGAEKLLGKGDMLFVSAQISKPKRVQGAFVDDKEIEKIVAYLREQGDPQYNTDVTEKNVKVSIPGMPGGGSDGGEDHDDLLEQAKDVILEAGKASASLLQRRLRVGYARAARILDILEEQGFIGPAEGAKPREILVSQEVAVSTANEGMLADGEKSLEEIEADAEESDEDEKHV